MSSKQGNQMTCEYCEYDSANKKHDESYWKDRSDPRDRDEKDFRFNSHYYAALDRQIAENATACPSKGNHQRSGTK